MAQRSFIITAHKASVTPDFTLNDLPGSAGRMDILARFITASFCLSHGIRKDVNVYLVLQDRLVVRIEGEHVKRLNPDERSTAALIKKALETWREKSPSDETAEYRGTPGVNVKKGTLERLLEELEETGVSIALLDEKGIDLREAELSEPIAFVLSDHQEFAPEEEDLLRKYAMYSVGPQILHADHCVTLVQNELDRRM